MERSKYSFNEVEQKLDIIQNDKGMDKYLRGDGTYAVPPSIPGITPNLTIGTVETLPSGSDATATITGDKENPVLNLGIPKGADGKSAYDIAVNNGFTGTEAEWLTSLKGSDGADGANGADGKDGSNGADGYTPVKGTDYWTDDDKTEIQSYIDTQIGGALNGSY